MAACQIHIGGNIYGAGNIGDDAALQGILCILESAAPEAHITVGTYQGQSLDHLSPSLQYVSSREMPQTLAAIRQSDCFISGGGTMIGDELNLSFPLGYNAKLISVAKLYGKKVSMLGIGANQPQHDAGSRIAATIVGLCDLITVRDPESRAVCLGLDADPGRTVTTADPAFLLEARETPRTKELKERLRARGRIFGVNVVNEAWTHLDEYKLNIARACDYLVAQYGYLPVFFCNEIRPGSFFDFYANNQTAALLTCDHEVLDPIYYTPEEMIDILSAFEFVMGMRMHALIFAAIAGVPFVTVSRVDKVDNFMRLFGFRSSGAVNRCDSQQLITDVERLLDNQSALEHHLHRQVETLRQECWRNVDLLRDLLNERRVFWHRTSASSLQFALSTNRTYTRLRGTLRRRITLARIARALKRAMGRKGAH